MSRQTSRTSSLSTSRSMPQRSSPLTRMPPSARLGNQNHASRTAGQPGGGARQTLLQARTGHHPPIVSCASTSGPASTSQASGNDAEQPQALYLGVFDLEETSDAAQQPMKNNRGGRSQRSNSTRTSTFGHWSTSSSTHHTTFIHHGYPIGRPYFPRLGASSHPYDYGYGYDFYHGWAWDALPWHPRPYVVVLPLQTIFTEVSTNYCEQDSPSPPHLTTTTCLEVTNRYYNGWRDAYTQALALSSSPSSEGNGISTADKARIERNREALRGMQDEAIRRLRGGDHRVVQETLERVRVDRGMAGDMSVGQVRWAVPWIREVWVGEHGEMPG